MRSHFAFLFITLVSVGLTHPLSRAVQAPDAWLKADAEVVRLSPAAFPELPQRLSRKLISLGCTIPQPQKTARPKNVIKGHFSNPKQIDWAVLCSRNRISSILIFWDASPASMSQIRRAADQTFLQTIDGNGTIGFSRTIAIASRNYVLEHYRAYHGPKPPPLSHQGIEDGFAGKGSTIYYHFGRRWRELQGAD